MEFHFKTLLKSYYLLPLLETTVEYNHKFCQSFYQWALLFIGIPWRSYSQYLEKISKMYLLPNLFLLYMTS